jgi:hypothetical protein
MKDRKLSEYQQKLLDPRWQRKRLGILQRDEWRCQKCFDDTTTLHVHHRYYEQSCEPWDYHDNALVTLCADCHQAETENRQPIEHGFLQLLRKIGLTYEDIDNLAYSFSIWAYGKRHDFTVAAIAWAIGNRTMMEEIVSRFNDISLSRSPQGPTDTGVAATVTE